MSFSPDRRHTVGELLRHVKLLVERHRRELQVHCYRIATNACLDALAKHPRRVPAQAADASASVRGVRAPAEALMSGPDDRLSLLGRRLSRRFELRVVSVAPGCARPHDDAEWRDALVVVERGEIELEYRSGTSLHVARGGVLWLSGLPLRALHNRGPGAAVLVAVSPRRPGQATAGGSPIQ